MLSGWSAVVTETDPFTFTDADGDTVEIRVVGDGQMTVTGTQDDPTGSDIESAVIAGGGRDSQFHIEAVGSGNGAQVANLVVDSHLDRAEIPHGDVGHVQAVGSLSGSVRIGGRLGGGRIDRDLRGNLIVDTLDGELSIGDDVEASGSIRIGTQAGGVILVADNVKGELAIAGDAHGDIEIGRDLRSTLSIGGDAGGVINIGDDVGRYGHVSIAGNAHELLVADNIKHLVTVGGDMESLSVGRTIWQRADVLIGGDLGAAHIGRDVTGSLIADSVSGALNIGRDLRGNVLTLAGDVTDGIEIGRDLRGTLYIAGNVGRVLHGITVGRDLRGVLEVGGNVGGLTDIGDDIGANAHLAVGGWLYGLEVGDDVKGAVSVGRNVYDVYVGGDLRDGAVIDVDGNAGLIDISGDVYGDIYVGGDVTEYVEIGRDLRGTVDIGGNVDGLIDIYGDMEANAQVTVGGDLYELCFEWGDVKGAVSVGGDLEYLWVFGNIRSGGVIDVAGTVGVPWPDIYRPVIGGDLSGSLRVGTLVGPLSIHGDLGNNGRLTITGDAHGDISIDGDVQGTFAIGGDATHSIEIGGDLRGTLDVGGNVGWMYIGDDIEANAHLDVGGRVTELWVADNVKTGFTVGGNLVDLYVDGDVRAGAVIDLHGNAEWIQMWGDVYGDIHVGKDLVYLESHCRPVEEIPDLTDVDYFFYVHGRPEGTLTVDGTIGTVVQI